MPSYKDAQTAYTDLSIIQLRTSTECKIWDGYQKSFVFLFLSASSLSSETKFIWLDNKAEFSIIMTADFSWLFCSFSALFFVWTCIPVAVMICWLFAGKDDLWQLYSDTPDLLSLDRNQRYMLYQQ